MQVLPTENSNALCTLELQVLPLYRIGATL